MAENAPPWGPTPLSPIRENRSGTKSRKYLSKWEKRRTIRIEGGLDISGTGYAGLSILPSIFQVGLGHPLPLATVRHLSSSSLDSQMNMSFHDPYIPSLEVDDVDAEGSAVVEKANRDGEVDEEGRDIKRISLSLDVDPKDLLELYPCLNGIPDERRIETKIEPDSGINDPTKAVWQNCPTDAAIAVKFRARSVNPVSRTIITFSRSSDGHQEQPNQDVVQTNDGPDASSMQPSGNPDKPVVSAAAEELSIADALLQRQLATIHAELTATIGQLKAHKSQKRTVDLLVIDQAEKIAILERSLRDEMIEKDKLRIKVIQMEHEAQNGVLMKAETASANQLCNCRRKRGDSVDDLDDNYKAQSKRIKIERTDL